jgi:hypothetical protein
VAAVADKTVAQPQATAHALQPNQLPAHPAARIAAVAADGKSVIHELQARKNARNYALFSRQVFRGHGLPHLSKQHTHSVSEYNSKQIQTIQKYLCPTPQTEHYKPDTYGYLLFVL